MPDRNTSFRNDKNSKHPLVQEHYELREGFSDLESEEDGVLLNKLYESFFLLKSIPTKLTDSREMNDYDGYSFFE
jgi:hypothetical protein